MHNKNSSSSTIVGSRTLRMQRPRVSVGNKAVMYFCIFSVFFMISFPKGGLKINEVPITIGYLLTVPLLAFSAASFTRNKISFQRSICAFACILLTLWSAVAYTRLGGQSPSFALAYFISILYIPIFCLLFFSQVTLGKWRFSLEKCLKYSVRFLALYAIVLFVFKYVTGNWIEIPYLTVNAADVGQLDEKHINRGGIFKAISTYNNGNIFGVCMIILMPLYNRIESKSIFKLLFIAALILTLSRTVWIGLIIGIIFIAISNGLKFLQVFYVFMASLFVGSAIYGVVILLGFDSSFLVDRNFGGRLDQFTYLSDAQFIPNKAGIDLPEIVYLGIIHNYGYFGLLLFLFVMLSPYWAMKSLGTRLFSERLPSACMQGVLIYLILAMSDAAFNYIPTMLIFWMIGAWGIWYAEPSLSNRSYSVAK